MRPGRAAFSDKNRAPALDGGDRFVYPPRVHTRLPYRRWAFAAAVLALTAAYCLVFLVRLPANWPQPVRVAAQTVSAPVHDLIKTVLTALGVDLVTFALRHGMYLVVISFLVPWLVMGILRRGRPTDLGCRVPNRYAWRLTIATYVLSLPFLVWMIGSAGFAAPYLNQLRRAGGVAFCLYYIINMLVEHFFLQGVVLAALRSDYRWPPPPVSDPANAGSPFGRILQRFGFAQSTAGSRGLRRLSAWLGLSEGCAFPVLGSGLLFALVHIGKDPRELLLSFPGGIALAVLSYRTNTWLTAFALHLATAGTAFAMVKLGPS